MFLCDVLLTEALAELVQQLGIKEAPVRVLLHQGVDDLLGSVETTRAGVVHALPRFLSGRRIQVHLQVRRWRGKSSLARCFTLGCLWSCSGVEWLPRWVRPPPHTAGRSSWLWPPAWQATSSCSPRRPSRSLCSPGWTLTSGNWWRRCGQLVWIHKADYKLSLRSVFFLLCWCSFLCYCTRNGWVWQFFFPFHTK